MRGHTKRTRYGLSQSNVIDIVTVPASEDRPYRRHHGRHRPTSNQLVADLEGNIGSDARVRICRELTNRPQLLHSIDSKDGMPIREVGPVTCHGTCRAQSFLSFLAVEKRHLNLHISALSSRPRCSRHSKQGVRMWFMLVRQSFEIVLFVTRASEHDA